ncbi:hypothetical protein [Streptomyces sp. NPDC051173]|uniref:hypothetical protein n=1 Tax=Streptomyces sp. NPDC051173 TaxID=3155164 RepID=UPI00344E97CF
MIRIVLTRRLTALTGQRDRAEARVPAVQLRLARLKNDRDQLLRDFDERAVLAQEQAGKLERNLREEEQRSETLADQLRQAREELAALRTVERWLQETVEHYLNAAEAPVEVIVHDGVVHGVERSRETAKETVRRVDPAVTSWSPVSPDEDPRVGWKIATRRLPEVARPPHDAELQAHYWPEADAPHFPRPGRSPEADQLPDPFSELARSLWLMADHLEKAQCTECVDALSTVSFGDLVGLACVATNRDWPKALGLVNAERERRRVAARGEAVSQ